MTHSHGTRYGYQVCRDDDGRPCAECRAWNAARAREKYRRRKARRATQ